MPDDDEQPEKVWDEYDWERFLQQQDKKTEKYMELLEKYIDHPDRDQIIAREMGWYHLLDSDGEKWAEEVDSNFDESLLEIGDFSDEDSVLEDADFCEGHPLYQAALALNTWYDALVADSDALQNHPASIQLSLNVSITGNKLAAALSDDDVDEIGMTIAYLKRGLKSVSACLESSAQLYREGLLTSDVFGALNQRLFQIRDGVINLMGTYRSEFRRRYEGQ